MSSAHVTVRLIYLICFYSVKLEGHEDSRGARLAPGRGVHLYPFYPPMIHVLFNVGKPDNEPSTSKVYYWVYP